jgi:tetratricopeptide (TPR) repeat protein
MKSESEVERVGLQQDMAKKAITTAKKKMEGFPVVIQSAQDLLSEAEECFSGGDYPKALELSLKSGDVFHRSVEAYEQAKKSMEQAEKMHDTVVAIGADNSGVKKMLSEARSVLESGNMEASREAADQCNEWAIGVCDSHLVQMATMTSENVDLAEELGLESSLSRHRIGEAKALIKNRDFENAKELIDSAREEIEGSLSQVATQVIENSESAVQYAKKIGADVTESEALLHSSKEALEQGNFQEALDRAEKAVEKVESTRKLEKDFIDLTYKADTIIGSAKRFGIDIKEAEKLLLKALDSKDENIKEATAYAQQALDLANGAIDGFAPHMTAELSAEKADLGEWVDAGLTVSNTGKTLANKISTQVLGDAETEGLEEIEGIRAGGSETIPFKLRMTARGTVPLAIKITSYRVFDDAEYVHESIVQVEVAETLGKEEEEDIIKMVAEKESKCGICRGSIKKGLPMVICPCGKEFHATCAGRAEECPACGASLT